MPVIGGLDHIIKHLKSWLKPSKHKVGIQFAPSKAHVEYVPKGVVGVISPWNYPIQLALMPVLTALAAGNRVMLKLSEYTPATNKVIKSVLEPFQIIAVLWKGALWLRKVSVPFPLSICFLQEALK